MNNWNYTEYISVVPYYLTNNYEYVYYDLYDIWSRLPVLSDFDRKNRESCKVEFTTGTNRGHELITLQDPPSSPTV